MLLSAVYGAFQSELDNVKRVVIIGMSLLTVGSMAFALFHLPGAGLLSLACIGNVLLYVYARWFSKGDYQSELGILTLICAESLIRFLIVVPFYIN